MYVDNLNIYQICQAVAVWSSVELHSEFISNAFSENFKNIRKYKLLGKKVKQKLYVEIFGIILFIIYKNCDWNPPFPPIKHNTYVRCLELHCS